MTQVKKKSRTMKALDAFFVATVLGAGILVATGIVGIVVWIGWTYWLQFLYAPEAYAVLAILALCYSLLWFGVAIVLAIIALAMLYMLFLELKRHW